MRLVFYVLLLLLALACRRQGDERQPVNYYELPATSGDTVFVVVEIPAGTNHKIEYNSRSRDFRNDTLAGADRIIDFLPYPGNYGFIPSTLVDTAQGGDGDALDVLVIGESRPTGTVMATKPIGTLLLRDRGEIDTKIIAVPIDSTERVFHPNDFLEFMLQYDAARRIIEDWFLNYKGPRATELIRWEDDKYAWGEIRKWQVKEE